MIKRECYECKKTFKIKVPIWKGRKVGLAKDQMTEDPVEVEILYKDKSGKRLYPYLYTMPLVVAEKYPEHPKRIGGHTIIEIPIEAFKAQEIIS